MSLQGGFEDLQAGCLRYNGGELQAGCLRYHGGQLQAGCLRYDGQGRSEWFFLFANNVSGCLHIATRTSN